MCSNMSRYHLSSTEQKLDHVRQQHKKMPSLLANIYGSPQVLINWNSVDGRCSQQLSPNWKLISNVSWQQEVPWCSKASVWRNFKDAFARHIKQKLGFFFCLSLRLDFSLRHFKNNSASLPAFIVDRSSGFSLSICTEKVCDSCLFDWTFQVFHLQFPCHVLKWILTPLCVDTFIVKCTYCLFTFQF